MREDTRFARLAKLESDEWDGIEPKVALVGSGNLGRKDPTPLGLLDAALRAKNDCERDLRN